MIRNFPTLYKFDGVKIVELRNAKNISELQKFGDIWELSFDYPMHLINANGSIVLDENEEPRLDYKLNYIQNEYLINYNEQWYIIKDISESRLDDGSLVYSVHAKMKAIELSYKNMYYLNLNSPIRYPVTAKEAILEVITYPFQIGVGNSISSSSNSITIKTSNLTTTDLIGKKVSIIENTGTTQTREITNYNASSGVATISPNWTVIPDTTSRYRVHNSKYSLGNVDSIFDGIYRGFEFRENTVLEALLKVRDMYGGHLTYDFVPNSGVFDNVVNLVSDNGNPVIEFRYGKNIRSVSRSVDMNVGGYTRVSPIGRKQLRITDIPTSIRTDNSITYDEHTLGQGDIFNFQYYLAQGYTLDFCKENFIRDFSFINDGYDNSQWLYDDAKEELDKLSLPKITYTMSVYDLSVLTGREYLSFKSGDRVRVIDNDLNINIDTTIFIKETNNNSPEDTSVQLSNFNDNMGDFLTRIAEDNNKYTEEKKLYGKANTIVIADELTSRDWRYADYVVPTDGAYTSDEIIQKAIDDISDIGGSIVMLDGLYHLKNVINMRSNIDIIGNGEGTIIYPSEDGIKNAIDINTVSNVSVSNIKFGTYDTENPTSPIYFEQMINVIDSNLVRIRNNSFDGAEFMQINLKNSDNITIEGNNFYDSTQIGVNVMQHCIRMVRIIDGKVLNNTFENTIESEYVIYIEREFNQIEEISILGNYINTKLVDKAIEIDGFISGEPSYINISNNFINIHRIGLMANNIEGGLISANIIIAKQVGIYLSLSNNVKITNNRVYMNDSGTVFEARGIQLLSADNNSILSNTVRPESSFAIDLGLIVSGDNNLVSNNDLRADAVTANYLDIGTGTVILGGNAI